MTRAYPQQDGNDDDEWLFSDGTGTIVLDMIVLDRNLFETECDSPARRERVSPGRWQWIVSACLAALFVSEPRLGQAQGRPAAKTRTEQIERERRHKQARLWPESESPIATRLNDAVTRGLLDGFKTGKGGNGPQFILGGMRSGQGASFGVGYRRSDIFHDNIGYRFTARGSPSRENAGACRADPGRRGPGGRRRGREGRGPGPGAPVRRALAPPWDGSRHEALAAVPPRGLGCSFFHGVGANR